MKLTFLNNGILDSIVASLIIMMATGIIKWLLENSSIRVLFLSFCPPYIIQIVINITAIIGFYCAALNLDSLNAVIFLAMIIFLFLAFLNTITIYQFNSVGVISSDPQISKGIDYTKALKMCQDSLDLLGVGAYKLTKDPEFIKAVKRCDRPSRPIRLLLSKPDNILLYNAASKASLNPNDYQMKVKESLRKIKSLKDEGKYNISVRFYESQDDSNFQQFRLMFVDDTICLFSYTVWGTGDGRHLPQIHFKKLSRKPEVYSFYYPFKEYFEKLWNNDQSLEWDFEEFI